MQLAFYDNVTVGSSTEWYLLTNKRFGVQLVTRKVKKTPCFLRISIIFQCIERTWLLTWSQSWVATSGRPSWACLNHQPTMMPGHLIMPWRWAPGEKLRGQIWCLKNMWWWHKLSSSSAGSMLSLKSWCNMYYLSEWLVKWKIEHCLSRCKVCQH